ncbi:MAG: hypothetical protein AAB532_02255 [Patescibacteria group bacterium]
MSAEHHVIYIPGLNDQRRGYERLIRRWSTYGVTPHVHRVGWLDQESFRPKLERLVDQVDQYLDEGQAVSLVGASAGGSAALNALIERPKITAVVNLFGRLRKGENVRPSLDFAARKSPAFKESVLLFESREPEMDDNSRRKVLCLTPLIDEAVPRSTVSLNGATNRTLYTVEHSLSGLLAITFFSSVAINFVKQQVRQG